MLKFVATSVLTCCGFACSICDACNCANCNCGCPCEPAAAATAPAPALATAPAVGATAYRTYSYQPAAGYQPGPAMSYRTYGMRTIREGGFRDAGWKVRGGL